MEKLAVIVPYRDRANHLAKFLPYMQGYLPNADIFIIEQEEGKPFNRGKLLNIGMILSDADYFALHDVDMLPVKSDYSFPEVPTLLATKAEQFKYKMPYECYFGGVVLINRKDAEKCNGFHNEFWGWGAEDDHFRGRILATVGRVDYREGIYNSLPHERKLNAALHSQNVRRWKNGHALEDGLTTCTFEIISREGNHIKVSI